MTDFESRIEISKTEELREKMRQPLIDFAKEYGDIWPSFGNYSQFLERKKDCQDRHIAQILLTCQEAGLAFVVKDAELPQVGYTPYPGAERDVQERMLKAGFRQTEKIEVL